MNQAYEKWLPLFERNPWALCTNKSRLRACVSALLFVAPISCNPRAASTSEPSGKPADAAAETNKIASLPPPLPLTDSLVPEGSAHNLGFLLEFRLRRHEDDTGKTYREAVDLCRRHGRMLCTEVQWLRACQEDPNIGRMQSWTASRRGNMVVTLGGGDCGDRNRTREDDKHPNRVGLCCERAVALRPTSDAGPWLGTGTRMPARLEAALNEGDEAALRNLLSDHVVRNGRKWTLDALLEAERKARAEISWTLFDVCEMRAGPVVVDRDETKTGRLQGILLSCKTLVARGADVFDYTTRMGLVQAGGPERYRIAQIDHKGTTKEIPGAR